MRARFSEAEAAARDFLPVLSFFRVLCEKSVGFVWLFYGLMVV